MSRRGDGSLFVGRLSKDVRTRDLEDVFDNYGRLVRCDVKYGAEMAYAFIDYEDKRDAEDALKYENGRDLCGSRIVVEWARGARRSGPSHTNDECYKCHRLGHWARDCPEERYRPSRGGYRRDRSRSRDRRRRSRSRSYERRRHSRSRSRSHDRHRRSPSRSPSKSPRHRSPSKSPRASLSPDKSPRTNGD